MTARSVLIASIAVIAMAGPAWGDARTQARKAFQEGLALIDRGEYDAAIAAFEAANAAVPHPDVQYNLAYACVDAGRFEEAVKWFEIYLSQVKSPPDEAEIRQTMARLRSVIAAQPREPDVEVDTTEPPPTNSSLAADATRLRELARAIYAISKERADELEAIARRIASAPPPAVAPTPSAAPSPAPLPPPDLPKADDRPVRTVEEYQEQDVVTAATRRAAKPEDAPAVVWVITQQEIRERGYETVAEALRTVAGLHVVDDHVFVDVGVRGVHGGLRGQSRIIKVLIDGFSVSFRPTSGNFLGLEMIPIRAVDRIELVRGPGSALYGANAFLGVLQIITRRGGDIRGGSITARGGVSTGVYDRLGEGTSYPSVAGDLIAGTQAGKMSVLIGLQAAGLDRSGLLLPSSSPLGAAIARTEGDISEHDTSSPLSLFAGIGYDLGSAGTLTLEGGWQRLHSRAEWLDYGALTHYTRVVLDNVWARLAWEKPLGEHFTLASNVAYGFGGPGEGHRIRPVRTDATSPDPARHLIERYASHSVAGSAEMAWTGPRQLEIRGGADFDLDIQDLRSVDTVFDTAAGARGPGDSVPAPDATLGIETLANFGAYLLVSARPLEWLDMVAGLRFDHHNRYGGALNGRLGAVFRVGGPFYIKALYGSSFRAPAADQLFSGAAYLGDALGCLTYAPCASSGLAPQIAHTGELVLGVALPERRLNAQITGYVSFVDDLIVSFPNVGGFFVTSNAGSYLSRGLELEISTTLPEPKKGLTMKGHLFASAEATTADIPVSQFSPAESIRDEFRDAALFPELSGGLGFDIAYLPAKLGLYLEGRYVGRRSPSGSNLALGSATYSSGELADHFVLDANLSTRDLSWLSGRETVISLRVTNLIGSNTAEGGFRGWDVPGAPRMIFLRLIQEF